MRGTSEVWEEGSSPFPALRRTGAGGTSAAIAEILQISRARNRALGVTGTLLFSGGHFAQCLEGSREGVEEVMSGIARDPRHTDITIIEAGAAAAGRFPDWSLA